MRNRRVRHRREARNEQKEAPRPHGKALRQKLHETTTLRNPGRLRGRFAPPASLPPRHTPQAPSSPPKISPFFSLARPFIPLGLPVAFPADSGHRGFIPGYSSAVSGFRGFCLPALRYVRGSVHGCRSPERSTSLSYRTSSLSFQAGINLCRAIFELCA